MIEEILLCSDSAPSFLGIFDFSIAPLLLFYAYIPILLFSLGISIYIFLKNRESLVAKVLLLLAIFFSLWVLDTLILWTAAPAHIVMFWWQIIGVFEVAIFTLGIIFVTIFGRTKSLPSAYWALVSIPLVITCILLPTGFNIAFFDIDNCEGVIGPLWNFIYAFEIASIVGILLIGAWRYRESKKTEAPLRQLPYITAGLCIFLGTFAFTNISGDFTRFYEIDLIGPLGMLVFFAYLGYIMLKFKTFGIKLFATQALVGIIWLLVGALIFVNDLQIIHVIIGITTIILVPFGFLLIRSVRKEIELRTELEFANKRQQETLRFITHEVKGYLTDGAAALDAILTETFGPIAGDMKTMVGDALTKNRMAVREIQNFLRIADFKTGKVSYAIDSFDIRTALNDMLVAPSEQAKTRGLDFSFTSDEGDYTLIGDKDQLLNHVFGNLVHNAINYTPSGSVSVHLSHQGPMIRIAITDSGVGLSEDDKSVLFTEGGHGKESRAVNPHSTGYGLFIAKRIVDAHHGRMWAESEGRGKGSTFFVELPTSLSKKDFGIK